MFIKQWTVENPQSSQFVDEMVEMQAVEFPEVKKILRTQNFHADNIWQLPPNSDYFIAEATRPNHW